MKQVAIVGIQGVPARYGGFETLVENLSVITVAPKSVIPFFVVVRIMPPT